MLNFSRRASVIWGVKRIYENLWKKLKISTMKLECQWFHASYITFVCLLALSVCYVTVRVDANPGLKIWLRISIKKRVRNFCDFSHEKSMASKQINQLYKMSYLQVIKTKMVKNKKATKIDEIFTVDLKVTTYCQIDGEDFVNFCGLLRKRKLKLRPFILNRTFSQWNQSVSEKKIFIWEKIKSKVRYK